MLSKKYLIETENSEEIGNDSHTVGNDYQNQGCMPGYPCVSGNNSVNGCMPGYPCEKSSGAQ